MQTFSKKRRENVALMFRTLCALKSNFTSIMLYQSVCLNNSWSISVCTTACVAIFRLYMSVCVTVYLCMPAYRYSYLYLSVYLPACLFICPLICLMFTALFPSLPFLSSDPPSAHITSSQLTSPPHTLMFSHGDEDTPSFICSADGNPPPTVLWQVQKDTISNSSSH